MNTETRKRAALYLIIGAIAASFFFSQKLAPSEKKAVITDCFDTVSELTVYSATQTPIEKCKKYMNNINAELSAEDSGSLLYRQNNGENVTFSQDAADLIEFGEKFSADNPEFFSIYLQPLVTAWDIKNNPGIIPDISSAMAAVHAHKQINLGAIAKGYVTDKLAEILRSSNVNSALLNLGGNTFALGKKPDGSAWKIGIQDPKDENGIIGVISAEDLAVVTSGDYQRYFELDGKKYHHIFDPQTGYPAYSGLHSATIITENAALADALSTAVFVAGIEKGAQLLKKYNVMGILITDDTVYFSKELENIFKQKNFTYKYEFLY